MEQIEVVLGEPMTASSSAYKEAVFKDLHQQWKENRRLLKFLPKPVPKSREEEGVAARGQRVCLDLVEYIGQVES